MKNVKLQIFGKVQGVCFRFLAKKTANNLKINGWVKNMDDGSIYIEAEGEEKNLEKFIKWCYRGPIFAKIDDVRVEYSKNNNNFRDFEIK